MRSVVVAVRGIAPEPVGSWRALAGLALLVVWGAGCGGDDPLARATGNAMEPPRVAKPEPPAPVENAPPYIGAVYLEPDPPTRGDTIRAVVDAEDPDGDEVTLRYRWEIAGQRASQTGSEAPLSWARKGDLVRVSVTASDGRLESEPYATQTEVANQPPQIHSFAFEPDSSGIVAGSELGVSVDLVDPDGDETEMTVSWFVNGALTSEGERFSSQGLRRGDRVSVTIEATDGEDDSELWQSEELEVLNAPPIIVSQPMAPGPDGIFRYQVRAEDPDRDLLLRYSLLSAPEGMTIEESRGTVEWLPRPDQTGSHVVEIVVTDRDGDYTTQRFTLDVGDGGSAPPASP